MSRMSSSARESSLDGADSMLQDRAAGMELLYDAVVLELLFSLFLSFGGVCGCDA